LLVTSSMRFVESSSPKTKRDEFFSFFTNLRSRIIRIDFAEKSLRWISGPGDDDRGERGR
jgi:hypothetical protein